MKIDGSTLSAYALARQYSPSSDNSLSSGMSGSGNASARNIPTVETSSTTMPSGLANALWQNASKQDKAQADSESLMSEFMELSKMSPVERLRKQLLEAMGLTEESLAQLPPETRSSIEEEIARTIKEKFGVDQTEQAGGADGQSVAGPEEAGV